MSHTCRLLLLTLWAVLTACAPPPTATDTGALEAPWTPDAGWMPDPEARGDSWTWGDGAVRVSVAETEKGDRTRGLWIELDGVPLATRLPTGQLAPLLIATPRADGTPPLRHMDGDRLVLALAGSEEHGCPIDALELALDVDRDTRRLTMLVSGVPYVLLDAEPVLVSQVDGARAAILPAAGSSWEGEGVHRAVGRIADRTVRLAFRTPPPWLQLQRHDRALEMDLDHSCEYPNFTPDILTIQVLP